LDSQNLNIHSPLRISPSAAATFESRNGVAWWKKDTQVRLEELHQDSHDFFLVISLGQKMGIPY